MSAASLCLMRLLLLLAGLLGQCTLFAAAAAEQLDLTPFIRAGDADGARAAAAVNLPGDPLNLTSYAGFVETTPGRHMYMWFFPAQSAKADAPLLIWLQGGPGGSSLFGLFSEMGPYSLSPELELLERPESWNKEYGMLFIDNPVGAGFSWPEEVDGPKGYCTNTKGCVADNLYGLIQGFYALFPEQRKVPLFITGESYGGHYVPAFAYKVHESNLALGQCGTDKDCASGSYCVRPHAEQPGMCHGAVVPPDGDQLVPLKGIAVGDGWIDPVNMIPGYPDMFFNQGLVSLKQKKVIQDYCDRCVAQIKGGNMTAAFEIWDRMLNGDIFPYPNLFHNYTGSNDYDNFLRTDAPAEFGLFGQYVDQADVRAAMHTGSAVFNDGHQCEMHLVADFHVSFAQELVTLLDAGLYRVFIYSGQLDVIIGAALTERFLNVLPWSGLAEYQNADRKVWRDATVPKGTDPVSGFVIEAGSLTQILIRGAGHIAPYDQPRRARDMIDHMVTGTKF